MLRKIAGIYLLSLLIFSLGYFVREQQLWPYSFIEEAIVQMSDRNIKLLADQDNLRMAAFEPDIQTGESNLSYLKGKGKLAITGSINGKTRGTYLVDSTGNISKRWQLQLSDVLERLPKFKHRKKFDSLVTRNANHGAHVFPDGSLLTNFGGIVTVKTDKCNNIEWLAAYGHHSVNITERKTAWVPVQVVRKVSPTLSSSVIDHDITEFSIQDGKILRKKSLAEILIESNLEAIWLIGSDKKHRFKHRDAFHINDIEELPSNIAQAFPLFSAGDLVMSLRRLNLIFVVDPKTWKVKWHQVGPWYRQHDPDFQPDGTITIFDNNEAHRDSGSRILKIDPKTREIKTLFQQPYFFTAARGKHEILSDGSIIMVESKSGRVLGVNPQGEIILEYVRRVKKLKRVLIVTSAQFIPTGYFSEPLKCNRDS